MSSKNEALFDAIADALVQKGYIVLDDVIDANNLENLTRKAHAHVDYKEAYIGRGSKKQRLELIRSDRIEWLSKEDVIDKVQLAFMESLRMGMNKRLFLGLFDYEAHYAHFKKGAHYGIHLDAFMGQSNRRLTTVLYLNKAWQPLDGGVLVLYDEHKNFLEEIEPIFGRLVIFLSDKFYHEVRDANNDRYSIAGWFRINASNSKVIDTAS